jgi:hypothetical protein
MKGDCDTNQNSSNEVPRFALPLSTRHYRRRSCSDSEQTWFRARTES